MNFSLLHYSHLLYDKKYSHLWCIVCILFSDRALRFLGLFECFSRIVWFSSTIFCLGWEIFYQIDYLVFFPYLPFRLGGFSPSQPNQVLIKPIRSGLLLSLLISSCQLLVFFLSYSTGLGGFLSITLHGSFGFFLQFSHWITRIFID